MVSHDIPLLNAATNQTMGRLHQLNGAVPGNGLLSNILEGRAGRMTHFLGTHQNRLDAKGRVSVPAPFRAALRGNGETNGNGPNGSGNGHTAQLVLRPSHQHPCIEAWPVPVFQALAEPLNRLDLFSEEHDDLASALYADAFPVESDKEGRIVLPDHLIAHAALRDAVVFMGLGRIFQIWEPEAAEHRRAEARDRARTRRLTLPGAAAAQGPSAP